MVPLANTNLLPHPTPKMASQLVTQFLAGLTGVPNTQTKKHATSVAIGHIYAMHAVWPKKEQLDTHVNISVKILD